jgi:glycosyltransferase involved in cell wall biosynthesis
MLAIIIPYFKLTFFEATLQSLANQTDKRFKVYIGDDASPENPSALLLRYQGQFDFLYKRFEENLGGVFLVKQWERCIALTADEEWLMILGDDDEMSSTCIEEFYQYLPEIELNNCKVVRYATIINDEVNQKLSTLYTHPTLEKATDFFYRRFTNQTRSSLSEYIFKRSSYEKFGFYNYELAWYADDRSWLEFSEFKFIFSINTSYVSFRLSQENVSRANYKIKEKQKVTLQFYKFLIGKHFNKFKRYQRKDLLLYYEQLVYKNKEVTFAFWFLLSLLFLVCFYPLQSIKFSRRLIIHLRNNV